MSRTEYIFSTLQICNKIQIFALQDFFH